MCQAHYYHLPLLNEAAKRLGLSELNIKFLSYKEIIEGLEGKTSPHLLKGLATKRAKGWAILMWKGRVEIITGTKNIMNAVEQYRIQIPTNQNTTVVTGRPASLGKVTGKVKIVRNLKELHKVEKGDVLVAKMTTPDYMIAIHKAVAMVTDEGGVTCHAAIVSRELRIPCIVGTKVATQVLTDGEFVEVDANTGTVKVLAKTEPFEKKDILIGKTIYRGKVIGKARIVINVSDFDKVKGGDILITTQTTPEFLSCLYKVGGFIVDEDSLTSHATLYGKALQIPSIMGTTNARITFEDGNLVELNATKGLVKRLRS